MNQVTVNRAPDLAAEPVPVGPNGARVMARRAMQQSGIVLVFLILFVALAASVPDFLSRGNITGLLLSVTLTGTLASTMMMVLALGEVDLSVASIVAFSGVVASVATDALGLPLGIPAGVLAGGAVGLCNGIVVAKFGVNSLIATLAAMEIVRGLACITSHGDAVMISSAGSSSWPVRRCPA